MKKWLLTALCAFVAGNALAGEWYYTGRSVNGSHAYFYDRSSTSTENGVMQVWRLSVLSSKQAKKEKADFYMILDEMNCKKKMSRNVTFTVYLNGENVYTKKAEGKWEYVIPGTTGEESLVQICSRDKEFYAGDEPFDVAKQVRKWLDEEVAKSTPQKNPASF